MGNGLDTQSIVLDDDTILPILVNMKNNNDENNKEINTWSINKIIKRSNFNYELGNKSKTFDKHFGELANFLDNNNLTDKIQDISQTYNKTELTTNLSYDQILSIYLYNQIEKIMNESFNIQSDKWTIYCSYLLSGLSKLPFQYDTVYRSIPQHEYKTGNIIRFNQFLPVSTSQKWFKSGYILEIKNGFRGRDISTFINQKPKTEILFNISNYYMINKIYTSYTNTYISCSEIPIPYSYKTIIWVDDNPENNHKLMQHFESNGIMIIPQLSTKGTIKYLEIISTIINKNILNNLRIISDMHRFEYKYDDKTNDKMVDKQAGITLIKELKKRNYLNKICIFTSKQNSNRSVRNINNIYAACEHPNVIVTSKEKVIKRFATFEKMDYKSMEKYVHKCNIFPEAVNGLIIEFLDIKQLILNENICIKLRYNNGDDSFGNFWEESITFNKKIDGKNNDLGNNKRIGIVSHYNIHRMSNEKIFSEKETKFIFEIYYELVPEWMIDFLNCNKNEITQKKIKKISKMECEYINKIDCIKIVCCKKLNNNVEDEIDEFFRKEILIPCDKLSEIFSDDTDDKSKEFIIWNEYTQGNPHLYECGDLTVLNGYESDPLNVNENT